MWSWVWSLFNISENSSLTFDWEISLNWSKILKWITHFIGVNSKGIGKLASKILGGMFMAISLASSLMASYSSSINYRSLVGHNTTWGKKKKKKKKKRGPIYWEWGAWRWSHAISMAHETRHVACMCLETQYLYYEGKDREGVSQIKQRLGISHFYQAPPRAATHIGDPLMDTWGGPLPHYPPVSVVVRIKLLVLCTKKHLTFLLTTGKIGI